MVPKDIEKQVEAQIMVSYESMYRLAYTYVKNPDDAMDIVQDSVYKAMTKSNDLRGDGAIQSWLFRIVVNTALDFLRKRSKEVLIESMPEEGAEDKYRDMDMLRALDVLEEKERTVIALRFFEDMKLQDIAAVTGDNLNTVKTVLYRSLKKLKIQMTEGASAS